jgi:hypothetical protein
VTEAPEGGRALQCRLVLAPLLGAVTTARRQEKERQRGRGVTTLELAKYRVSTLRALEEYAAALEAMAWPVPRNLQTQIRMYRALLSLPPSGSGSAGRPGVRDG